MKYIPILLASFFTFLFAIFALLPSIKFTGAQRNKYPFLKKLDGKQIFFTLAAITCGFIVAITTAMKDYVAMQPQTETNQESDNLSKEPIKTPIEEQSSVTNNTNSSTNTNAFLDEKIANQQTNISQETNSSRNTSAISNRRATPLREKSDLSADSKKTPNKMVNSPSQSLSKARSLISQAKYTEAINECDRILRINPNNSEATSLKNWAIRQLKILQK